MDPRARKIVRILHANTRALAGTIAVLLTMSTLVAVSTDPSTTDAGNDSFLAEDGAKNAGGTTAPKGKGSATGGPRGTTTALPPSALVRGAGGKLVPPGLKKIPLGVDYVKKKIKIVFYWNDSSQASPYLTGSGQEGNLDDGEAFRTFVTFINRHKNGGRTFMGIPFNLHGFEIDGKVIHNVGKDSSNFTFWANEMTTKSSSPYSQPFAAMSARSSPSAMICPPLAKAGIYNFGTYDFYLAPSLHGVTNGYCRGFGLSFERQVKLTAAYLKWHQAHVPLESPTMSGPRVYGFLYAAYNGLVQNAGKAVDQLRAAGINIPKPNGVAKVNTDLATAQGQMGAVIDQFRNAGVNTIIMPDAGSPLNFTHAAAAKGYHPDYYVWPCSGQDSTGFVRLLNASQWARAQGLTCYDDTLDADLTNDDKARTTEWYRQFREIKRDEPPAPTPLVYAQLAPLLAGLTAAGPLMDPDKFRAGLELFKGYRYSGVSGKTTVGDNVLLDFAASDGSIWGDAAKVHWNPARARAGGTAGAYDYQGSRRYRPGDRFS